MTVPGDLFSDGWQRCSDVTTNYRSTLKSSVRKRVNFLSNLKRFYLFESKSVGILEIRTMRLVFRRTCLLTRDIYLTIICLILGPKGSWQGVAQSAECTDSKHKGRGNMIMLNYTDLIYTVMYERPWFKECRRRPS